MSFYENTLIAKQDISKAELVNIKEKYSKLINETSGKLIKFEDWGLLNFSRKIEKYNKGYYFHFKFEGDVNTISNLRKNIKLDESVLRHLIVKYKKLDTKTEYFNKNEKK